MGNLRELRNRITSIKSTKKITSAMKMVAASRLRQAQEALSESGYFAASLGRIMIRLSKTIHYLRDAEISQGKTPTYQIPKLLLGSGDEKNHLIIVFSSSRGLCGGFNVNVIKKTIQLIKYLKEQGKSVKLICVGARARDMLKNKFGESIIGFFPGTNDIIAQRTDAEEISARMLDMYDAGTIDACSVIFNKFNSAISQEVHIAPLVPLEPSSILKPFTGDTPWGFRGNEGAYHIERQDRPSQSMGGSLGFGVTPTSKARPQQSTLVTGKTQYVTSKVSKVLHADYGDVSRTKDPLEYDFEPSNPETLLKTVLPKVLTTLIYRSTLESAASENGARMTAMENATNNAGDIIDALTLLYNRNRQAMITSELSEIISGAEAL